MHHVEAVESIEAVHVLERWVVHHVEVMVTAEVMEVRAYQVLWEV